MTSWSEQNFLERLMPYLQVDGDAPARACPDSEALVAFLENRLDWLERDEIAAHLTRCKDCAELHNRLVSFSKSSVTTEDREWGNAEKRLAIWFTGLIQDDKNSGQVAARTSKAPSERWWRSWRLQLAITTIAALVTVTVAATLLRRQFPWRSDETQVAFQQQPAQIPNGTSTTTANTGAAEQPAGTFPAANEHASSSLVSPKGGTPSENGGPAVLSQEASAPRSPTPPSQAARKDLDTTVAHAPTSRTTDVGLPTANQAPNQSTSAAARRSAEMQLATEPLTTAQAASLGEEPAVGAGTTASPSALPPPPSSGNSNLSVPVPAPRAIYRIQADIRLWIKISSISRRADGSFVFRGFLLRPVRQTGSVPLPGGTEVIGSGWLKQGKTSLLVSELVVAGHHYTLVDGLSGSGPAVSFEDGNVLEMFVGSSSSYVDAGEGTKRSQPN